MLRRSKLSIAVLAALGSHALAPIALAQEGQKLERVEVTGSSIKRVDAESSLPVTTVTRADIAKSGVRTTDELVQQLTAVSSAGGLTSGAGSGLTTYGQSSVSMRGLGAQRTLVLVNGRRLAVFAGSGGSVNVNAIPLAAIERVEVLQDGASGVYGSDAVAGVINFILRKNVTGVDLSATYGEPTRGGGGKNSKVSAVAGFGDYDRDRFTVSVSAAYEKETNMLGAARDYTKSDTRLPYYAGGATETGRIEGVWKGNPISDIGEVLTNGRSITNPYGISNTGYGNPMAAAGKCAEIGMAPRSGKGFSQGQQPVGGPAATQTAPNCTFDTGPFVGLIPNREFMGFTGDFRFKLSKDHELFADGLYSRNEVVNPIQPAPHRAAFSVGNTNFKKEGIAPLLLIYPQNPNYKIAADYLNSVGLGAMVGEPLGVSQRTFLIGPRTTSDVAEQSRLVVGARGLLGNVDYEFGYAYNKSETKGSVIDGFASLIGLTKVLNDPKSTWNPWAPLGKQPDDVAAAIKGVAYVGPTIASSSINQGADLKFSGTLMELAGGSMGMAAGINARTEEYVLSPSPAMNSGDVIGMGAALVPVDANRSVWAMFAELNMPFHKTLEANLAVRQDNYSDFGTTNNAKASLRWQPMKQLMMRSSVGTGFRAPTLVDLYQPQQIGTTEQFIDPAFPGNGNIQTAAVTGGNPNLSAEKSKQFSIGLVAQPISSVTATIDYYQVKLDDAIATPSALELVAGFRRGDAAYKPFVEVNGANEITKVIQVPANVSSIKTDGIDIDLRWREKLGGGRLDVGLAGSYVLNYDLINTSGQLEKSVGTIVRPDGAPLVSSPTGVILEWKHNFSVGYTHGDWSATMTQRFYKGYEMVADLDGNRMFVPNTSKFDLVASYSGIKNTMFTVGVRNLLDKDPPLFINNGSQFQSGYDVFQEDPRGRFVYVTAGYKF